MHDEHRAPDFLHLLLKEVIGKEPKDIPQEVHMSGPEVDPLFAVNVLIVGDQILSPKLDIFCYDDCLHVLFCGVCDDSPNNTTPHS